MRAVLVPVGDAAITAHLRLECNHLELGPPTLRTLQQKVRHPATHAHALSQKDHWEIAYRWWLVQALETLAEDYNIHLNELGRLHDALNRLRRAPQPQGSDPHAHRMWDPDYLSGEESPHRLGTTSRAGTLRRDAIYGFRVPSM
ncbi:uncharacterized protein JCM10292_005803 [Rhodotorula paludigena]|uniref:uncharacterized protein n=1 Tax=Rhodotorula paludigena TaxID=86838 RepID=UPI0031708A6A